MQTLLSNSKINRKKRWTLSFLAIALIATMLLAAGLSGLELLPGRSVPMAGILGMLGEMSLSPPRISIPIGIIRLITGCLWLLLFISIIAFIVSPEVRKVVLRRAITYLLWFLAIFALIRWFQPQLPLFGAGSEGPSDLLPSDIQNPAELLPTPPDFIVNPPSWFVIIITILLIAVPLTIIWLLWRFVWTKSEEEAPLEMLTREAQQALDGLQAGKDLKDTIMRCYWEMSQILSKERNLHRPRGMTVREFEQYLADYGLRTEHIQQLSRLFERVRYGSKSPGPREEKEAMACLRAIVKAYGRPS